MSISYKIADNVDYSHFFFGQNLQKSRIWSIFSKNSDFGQNCRKIMILVNIFGKSRFQSISSVKFSPHLGFGKNFRKISIWVKICKYVDLGQKLPKISIWVKIFDSIDFGEKCRKISNLIKFVE